MKEKMTLVAAKCPSSQSFMISHPYFSSPSPSIHSPTVTTSFANNGQINSSDVSLALMLKVAVASFLEHGWTVSKQSSKAACSCSFDLLTRKFQRSTAPLTKMNAAVCKISKNTSEN